MGRERQFTAKKQQNYFSTSWDTVIDILNLECQFSLKTFSSWQRAEANAETPSNTAEKLRCRKRAKTKKRKWSRRLQQR